jgi:hypothetical protein
VSSTVFGDILVRRRVAPLIWWGGSLPGYFDPSCVLFFLIFGLGLLGTYFR